MNPYTKWKIESILLIPVAFFGLPAVVMLIGFPITLIAEVILKVLFPNSDLVIRLSVIYVVALILSVFHWRNVLNEPVEHDHDHYDHSLRSGM